MIVEYMGVGIGIGITDRMWSDSKVDFFTIFQKN